MLASNRDAIADILDRLAVRRMLNAERAEDAVTGQHMLNGANALRWCDEFENGSPEDIAAELKDAKDEVVRLTDETVDLRSERDDVRLYVKALKKALDALPNLIEAVSAETSHEDCGECAVTRLVTAVDEARKAAKDALAKTA